jgi:ABC-type antimicrobial peptide transport system permease subunit
VRTQFLLETFFLSAAACLVGILLAFLGMYLLRLMHFEVQGNPMGMLLVEGRLHFKPTSLGIGLYLLLILAIAAVTAWFPARRAANLSPSEALRHFG